MPQVTVIIPNYNHGPYLRARIESVIQQTFQDIELIIIDDYSSDNSHEIIDNYAQHPLVRAVILNTENSGSPFSQWSKALQLAAAEWIWVAESDDLAEPDFLEKLYPKAIQHKQISLAYCDSMIFTEQKELLNQKYSYIKNRRYGVTKWSQPYQQDGKAELNEFLKKDCTINNLSAVLFRKSFATEVLDKLDGFRFHGDWMFYITMAEKGQVIYVPETLNHYREHAANHSKALTGYSFNKPECFRILNYLLEQSYISDKKQLIRHFTKAYLGFGLQKEKPFSADGLFRQYQQINHGLARKVLWQLIKSKIIPG